MKKLLLFFEDRDFDFITSEKYRETDKNWEAFIKRMVTNYKKNKKK